MTTDPTIPLQHIVRSPLPWRDWSVTECGKPIAEFAVVINREEAIKQLDQFGKQRFGLLTCMTCIDTAGRWPTWADDPVRRLERETYMGRGTDERFHRELLAVAALIAAHRDEFDGFLADLDQTTDLAAARKAKVKEPRRSRGSL